MAVLIISLFFFGFNIRRLAADVAYGHGNAISEFLKKPDPSLDSRALILYAQAAVHELEKAVRLCPVEVKYRLYLGLAFEQLSQIDNAHSKEWLEQALLNYKEAIRMSPANAYYHNDEGRTCDALARFDPAYLDRATEAYGSAVQWAPESPLFILNWAVALQKSGKNSESREAFQKAFSLDAAFSSKVISQMALTEYRSGREELASRYIQHLDAPARSKWFAQVALDEYRAGHKEKAFSYLAKTIREYPAGADALYCRGILYLEEGRKKLALTDLETAKRLDPSLQAIDDLITQAQQ